MISWQALSILRLDSRDMCSTHISRQAHPLKGCTAGTSAAHVYHGKHTPPEAGQQEHCSTYILAAAGPHMLCADIKLQVPHQTLTSTAGAQLALSLAAAEHSWRCRSLLPSAAGAAAHCCRAQLMRPQGGMRPARGAHRPGLATLRSAAAGAQLAAALLCKACVLQWLQWRRASCTAGG
jgi:hypothetical protein